MPLSPRTDPVVAWTGTEVLVVGGNTGFVCPPNADLSGETSVEATNTPDRPLQDSQLFVTPAGPVVAGVRYRDAAPDEPTLAQVDVPDVAGGWRRFETGQIGWLTHWDGSRLVGVEPGERRDLGRPDSDLDHSLSATWAGDRLFVFGGVNAEVGYEASSAPEAWLWSPR